MSTLNGKSIYIYADSYWDGEPVWGELHVIEDDETTLHYVGSQSYKRNISFWLLQPSDYASLSSARKAGTTVTLVDWNATSESVKIMGLSVTDALWDIRRSTSNYTVLRCRAELLKT